jgi:uncharacterized protein involved in high-affinity Fe2+ transport
LAIVHSGGPAAARETPTGSSVTAGIEVPSVYLQSIGTDPPGTMQTSAGADTLPEAEIDIAGNKMGVADETAAGWTTFAARVASRAWLVLLRVW